MEDTSIFNLIAAFAVFGFSALIIWKYDDHPLVKWALSFRQDNKFADGDFKNAPFSHKLISLIVITAMIIVMYIWFNSLGGSTNYWNSKGEPVDSYQEALK